LIEFGQLVLEKILKNFQCIFTPSLLSPLGEGLSLHLNKLKSSTPPPPQEDLRQIWLKLAQWFWRRRFLKIFSVFLLSLLSPLGEALSPLFVQT
jgi:hypothetical protein